jgi:hypothetical protein
MKRLILEVGFSLLVTTAVVLGADAPAKPAVDWAMNATIIEACSCPMFCQCYFNTKPASTSGGGPGCHADGYCRFNNAFKVNKGHFADVKLDGLKFWVYGDLGGDFTKGMKWASLAFEPAATQPQRDAVVAILQYLYPVKWESFTVAADGEIQWQFTKDRAEARLNGGKTAEVVLNRFPGMTDDSIVIKNLKYWGAPRNDGFVLMPNEVEAYREGDKAYEFKGTNGFMITFDIASKDVK